MDDRQVGVADWAVPAVLVALGVGLFFAVGLLFAVAAEECTGRGTDLSRREKKRRTRQQKRESGKRSVPVTHGVLSVVTIHQVVPTLNIDLLIEKSYRAVRQQDMGPARVSRLDWPVCSARREHRD